MPIRIPGPDEPASFGPPITRSDPDAAAGLSHETRAAVGRMQARDDALFVAGALADLVVRRNRAVRRAETEAFDRDDTLERAADGFAASLADAFDADVEAIATDAGSLGGPRPSDRALDLFRRKAQALKQPFAARAAVMEDALRRQGQQERIAGTVAAMGAMVRDDPDTLDEAAARIDDLAAASGALLGHPAATALKSQARRDLQAAAMRGLIARDPAGALSALKDGAQDDALDDETRRGFEAAAALRAEALDRDGARARTAAAHAAERKQGARAAAFLAGFERRLSAREATLAEIADAETDGVVSTVQAARLRSRVRDSDADEARRRSLLAHAVGTLERGAALDPSDPDDRAAAELWFDRIVGPAVADAPAPDAADAIVRLAGQLGILPDAAASRLRGILIAAEPDGQVAAARAFGRLRDIAPDPTGILPPGERHRALRLSELDGLGLPAADAVRLADSVPMGSLHADRVAQAPQDDAGWMEATGDPGSSFDDPNARVPGPAADGIAPSFDAQRLARANVDVDDDGGLDEGGLTTGAIRRGADRIGQAFDRDGGKRGTDTDGADDDAAEKGWRNRPGRRVRRSKLGGSRMK